MNRLLIFVLALAVCAPLFTGCGPSEEERRQMEREEAMREFEDAAGEAGEGLAEAMGAFGEAMNEAAGGNGDRPEREPIEREALRDMVPEEIGGMERTSINSARDGAMGMTVTYAEAEYTDGERTFELKITDMAGVPFAGMMGAAWATADIDRESDSEIERTTTYEGHRAYEKYNSASNSGEYSVLVNGFLVEGRGRGMSRDGIEDAMDDVPVDDLDDVR